MCHLQAKGVVSCKICMNRGAHVCVFVLTVADFLLITGKKTKFCITVNILSSRLVLSQFYLSKTEKEKKEDKQKNVIT